MLCYLSLRGVQFVPKLRKQNFLTVWFYFCEFYSPGVLSHKNFLSCFCIMKSYSCDYPSQPICLYSVLSSFIRNQCFPKIEFLAFLCPNVAKIYCCRGTFDRTVFVMNHWSFLLMESLCSVSLTVFSLKRSAILTFIMRTCLSV